MAWNPNGGGPWGGGPSAPPPPNVEEMLRHSQDRLKKIMPGGWGTGRGIALVALGAVVLWTLYDGLYRVQPGEVGVELLFGRYYAQTGPGLHIWFPRPIGDKLRPNVERTNQINIGFQGSTDATRGGQRDIPQESLMLSGDQNIIDVDFVVQWRIKDAADYLFNIRDVETTVKVAAESAIREVMGKTTLENALTTRRQEVDQQTKELLQSILDDYGAGVFIAEVKQLKVDPPTEVIDAFNDVQRARQDKERSVNEALAYRNDIVPRAKGQAERVIQEATAYKEKVIREAEGEAKRFLAVYEAYKQGKDVTRRRLYLERMQEVLGNTEMVIIDSGKGGTGVVPYLPLPELRKRIDGGAR